MSRNMGAFDRGLRAFLVAPVAVIVAFLIGAGTVVGIVLLVVVGLMLTTAAAGFCPTYTIIGISTHPRGLHRVARRGRAGQAQSTGV
jgi:Protein of unknown function (DUF2892)